MDLKQAKDLAVNLMEQHGLFDQGWSFRFDRSRRRLGLCRHGCKTISISIFNTQTRDEVGVRNTILHEIAHALVGVTHGHDETWREKAISIGCNGQRCSDSSVAMPSKYGVQCVKCSNVFYFYRRPNWWGNFEKVWHNKCGKTGALAPLSINELVAA